MKVMGKSAVAAVVGERPSLFCVPLDAVDQSSQGMVGTKASTLGWVLGSGIAVPPGFVVSAGAYRAFASRYRLCEKIDTLLHGVDLSQPEKVWERTAQIRQVLYLVPMPEEVKAEIVASYEAMGGGRVAIRPSPCDSPIRPSPCDSAIRPSPWEQVSVHQDQALHAESKCKAALNVEGAASVAEAVRACWASFFEPAALCARAMQGLPPADIHAAVLVQRMLRPQVSGIMLTRDPSSRGEFIRIEAWHGLGLGAVVRELKPDTYEVDRAGLGVARSVVAPQPWMLRCSTKRVSVPTRSSHEAKLNQAQLGALAAIGMVLERRQRQPQAVEFAVADRSLQVLQSERFANTNN